MLAARSDATAVTKALSNGAQGYVLKDAPFALVLKAVRPVHAGETWVQREVVGQLTQELQRSPDEAAISDGQVRLTEREQEVLKLLAAGRSTAEMADDLVISESTVRVHVARILGKLGVDNRILAVRYAIREGLAKV